MSNQPNRSDNTTSTKSDAPSHLSKKFTVIDVIVVIVIFLSLGGAVVITITTRLVPETVIAVLLSVGISALVYQFLGGISPKDASFGFGAFRTGGSLAALAGLVFFLTPMLERQLEYKQPVQKLDGAIWGWQNAERGWRANIEFDRDSSDSSVFAVKGNVRQSQIVNGEASRPKIVRRILKGSKAWIDEDGHSLHLKLKVRNEQNGVEMEWNSVAPFKPEFVLRGQINVTYPKNPNYDEYNSPIYLQRTQ